MKIASRWKLKISTLSPIHVGSGEELDPFSYVVDKGTLFVFSQSKFLDNLPVGAREELSRLSNSNLNQLQSFFGKYKDIAKSNSVSEIRVPQSFVDLYKNKLGRIDRIQFDSAQNSPLCPGSSIKGAIRTALLDAQRPNNEEALREAEKEFDKRQNQRNFSWESRKYEKNVQNILFSNSKHSIKNDPMRLIHIADGKWNDEFNRYQTKSKSSLVFALNRKKKKQRGNNSSDRPQQILEVVESNNENIFVSELVIYEKIKSNDNPRLTWSMEDICVSCQSFYLKKFKEELKELDDLRYLDKNWQANAENLVNHIQKSTNSQSITFILRIGRHSGAESVTLNELRRIRIKKNPKPQQTATTWWLASRKRKAKSNFRPFGWVHVECIQIES